MYEETNWQCRQCSHINSIKAKFCSKCGTKFEPSSTSTDKQSEPEAENLDNIQGDRFIVSTGDIPCQYKIIEPVYCHISDEGAGNKYDQLLKKYQPLLKQLEANKKITKESVGGLLGKALLSAAGGFPRSPYTFQCAFYLGIEELKEIARTLDANGIIYLRQNTILGTASSFHLQLYGTAVKIIETE